MTKTRWVALLWIAFASARAWADDDEDVGLRVKAVDAAGAPVLLATARLTARSENPSLFVVPITVELRDGEARFPAPRVRGLAITGPLALEVYRARSADGAPLPLAPGFFSGPRPDSDAVSVRLGPGRRLAGTARDTSGAPLSSCDVIARTSPESFEDPPAASSDDVRARAAVDGAGRFVLEGLDEREVELWLVDRASGDVVSDRPVLAAGGATDVAVVRDANPAVRIRLVGPDGRPVARAQVRATPERQEDGFRSLSVFSDEAGVARFAGLDRRRKHGISVEPPSGRDDVARLDVDGWVPNDEEVLTVPAGRTVEGLTVDAEGKGTRAWVHHRFAGGRRQMAMTSDRDGRFDFRGVPLGPVELGATPWFESDPSASAPPGGIRWTTFPADTAEFRVPVQVSVPPPVRRRLAVHVVGPDGTAPERVTVEFGHWSAGESHTARGGRTAFEVTEGAGFVRAYAAQRTEGALLPWAPAKMDVRADATEVELRMPEGRAIEGRVVDESHRPTAGLTVVAIDRADTSIPGLGVPVSWAHAGADGAFVVPALGPGEFDLSVEETTETPRSSPVRASPGDRGVVLTVRRASPTRIRVVDAEGRPVSGAHLTVMRHFETESGSGATSVVVTDTPGDAVVDLPPLDPTLHVSLRVEPPDARDDLSTLDVDPWRPTPGAVTMPKGYTAVLTVLDEDGRIVKAHVTRIVAPETPGLDFDGTQERFLEPDEANRFRVRALPLGPLRFTARPDGKTTLFPPSSAAVEVDETHPAAELRIPTRPLRMTVTAEGAGPRTHVVLLAADRGTYTAATRSFDLDRGGRATIDDLARGTFEVFVLRRSGATGPVGRARVEAFAGGDVAVPTAARVPLRVRVKAPPGTTDVEGSVRVGTHPIADLTLDTEGRYACGDLPAGRYRVTFLATAGPRSLGGSAMVETGTDAEIQLRPRD